MAWRIHDHITRGEIDNRTPGHVKGKIWLAGTDKPLRLSLRGNCWSDLAGSLLRFENPNPLPNGECPLNPEQNGVVGDMTVSRKLRIPTVDDETMDRLLREKKPIPTRLGNCIYLEWFSEENGRVVIEAAHYHCELSPPEWSMTNAQERAQQHENEENLSEFLQNLVNHQSIIELSSQNETETETPLDEFQWEKLLRQSDEICDQYLEALERFHDEPDRDRLIAEEMGWEWLDEEPPELAGLADEFDCFPCGGDKKNMHPLVRQACDLMEKIVEITESRNIFEKYPDEFLPLFAPFNDMLSKLTASLESAAVSEAPESGFIVATLKRSLPSLHESIDATNRLSNDFPEEADWLEPVRDELFIIRQKILSLMQKFRNRLND